MNKNIESFLKELTALSRKYNLEIGGCGCCGSPWIYEINKDQAKDEFGYFCKDDETLLRWTTKEEYEDYMKR